MILFERFSKLSEIFILLLAEVSKNGILYYYDILVPSSVDTYLSADISALFPTNTNYTSVELVLSYIDYIIIYIALLSTNSLHFQKINDQSQNMPI